MIEVEFHYQLIKTKIRIKKNDTIKDAINQSKIIYSKNIDFSIIVHNRKLKGDEIIESIMTEDDKKNNSIKIILLPLDNKINYGKDIICPECLEPCQLNINKYRINLGHISGMHNIENIKFREFKKMQNDLLNKINCNICKNRSTYKCSQCNIFFCQKCKVNHDENHKVFIIEENKYICLKHEQLFIKYCVQCDENICKLCEKNHSGHYINSFEELFPEYADTNDLYENLRKLRNGVNLFNRNLKEIIQKLNKVVENMEMFYKISENIINNYCNNYTNYSILQNVFDINNNIIKELENIEECDYGYNINKILYFYNEMEEKNIETEITYEFLLVSDNDEKIKIFGDKFIDNNLYKCKIIYDDNEYDLNNDFYPNFNYSNDFQIKIKGINNIINMSYMFENCTNIKSIYDLNNIDTSKVINMKNMFDNCVSLTNISNINNWNTSNVMNMEGMFSNNKLLQHMPDISKWDTSNVSSMMNMFYNCELLKSLPDISKWTISNIIDMRYMFCNCHNLISLPDISNWTLINVKYLTSLFKDCSSLLSLPDISKWNTSNIKSMNDFVQNCYSLTTIPDISKWNVSNVNDFSYSFMGCFSLTSLPDISKWDIKNCRNLDGMFIDCLSLSSLPDFEKWKNYKINNKHSMFKRCFNSLKTPIMES